MGNSSGVFIPKPLLAEIDAKTGDAVEIAARDGDIVVSLVRAGWAATARLIADSGEKPTWPAFSNEGDHDLKW